MPLDFAPSRVRLKYTYALNAIPGIRPRAGALASPLTRLPPTALSIPPAPSLSNSVHPTVLACCSRHSRSWSRSTYSATTGFQDALLASTRAVTESTLRCAAETFEERKRKIAIRSVAGGVAAACSLASCSAWQRSQASHAIVSRALSPSPPCFHLRRGERLAQLRRRAPHLEPCLSTADIPAHPGLVRDNIKTHSSPPRSPSPRESAPPQPPDCPASTPKGALRASQLRFWHR